MKSNKEIIHMQNVCNLYFNAITVTCKYPDLVSLKYDGAEEDCETVLASFANGDTVKCNVEGDNDWGMLKDILRGLSKRTYRTKTKFKDDRELLCKWLCETFKATCNYPDLISLEYVHIPRSEIVIARFRNGSKLKFKFRTAKTGCHLIKNIIDGLDAAAGGFMMHWDV